MKKFVYALVMSLILFASIAATSISTINDSWQLLRAEGNEDAAVLDLTTSGAFASKPSTAKELSSTGETLGGGVCITACAGVAADKTFTVMLYGWRAKNGMAQPIASIAFTTGTQAVVKYPHSAATATAKFWADTAVVTSYSNVSVTSSATTGANQVAEVVFDAKGFKYLYAEVTNADGSTGAEAANVSVYYSKY